MNVQLSAYYAATPPFVDGGDGVVKRIVFATRTASVFVVPENYWSLMADGRLGDLPAPTLAEFIESKLIVPAGENELEIILRRHREQAAADDRLALVIQPTASCQLGCGYCGQHHSKKQLSVEHQDLFLQSVSARLASGRYRKLGIGWFGAEPLAGRAVMRRMSPKLRVIAAAAGCEYASSVVTNGLALTDDVATELAELHCVNAITVSLDGTRDVHDVRRPTKAGGRTFDRIFANLLNICRREDLRDISIDVRANVDRRNWQAVSPLLELLAEAGLQSRIRFYVAPIHSWGNDAHKMSLSAEEFADQEIAWFAEMATLGFAVSTVPDLIPIVCIAVRPESELVDANGDLYNCTEVSYVPAYGTPNKFAIGHVASGESADARRAFGDFNDRVASGAYGCSNCRMLPVCGGACPKEWLEGRTPCPSAKRNIEQRLLLAYALSRLKGARASVSRGAPARV
jgi:uncharacterized protein